MSEAKKEDPRQKPAKLKQLSRSEAACVLAAVEHGKAYDRFGNSCTKMDYGDKGVTVVECHLNRPSVDGDLIVHVTVPGTFGFYEYTPPLAEGI